MSTSSLQCIVKFDGAGFFTNTVKGKRATCTWSDEVAAQRLADRLFGEGQGMITKLPEQAGDKAKYIESRWKLSGSALQENQSCLLGARDD